MESEGEGMRRKVGMGGSVQDWIRAFWLSFMTNCCSSRLSLSLILLRSTFAPMFEPPRSIVIVVGR